MYWNSCLYLMSFKKKKKKIPDSNSADFILRDMLKVFKVSAEVCLSAVAVCGAQQHCILTIFPVFDFQLLCDIVSVFHWPVVLKTVRHPKVKSGSFSLRWSVKMAFQSQTNGSLSDTEREMQQRIWDMQKRWNADLCHFEDFSLLLDLSVFWWWAWSAVKLICAFKSLDFYFGSVLVTGFSSVTRGQ